MSEPEGLTDLEDAEELRRGIAAMSAVLKGPLRNMERALLVADRLDMRAALASIMARQEIEP